MTAKDFRTLARIVADVPAQGCGPVWLAHRIADALASGNPRFDRDRFIAACAGDGNRWLFEKEEN